MSVNVTVVIPTHNRAGLLSRTLRAVLAQRRVDLEVVVIDDGSSDGTYERVLGLADSRIRALRNDRPQGVSTARNQGIAAARGEWIAFLDDDDLWAPEKLIRQVDAARAQGCGWAFGGAVVVTPQLEIVMGGPPPSAEEASRYLPWRNTVSAGASNVVVHRKVLSEVGLFDARLRHMSDWDLWIRLGQYGPPAVLPDPLLAYVLHPGNASVDTPEIPTEMRVVEARYAHLRQGRRVDRAYVYRWIGWNSLRMGRRRGAFRAYSQAVLSGDLTSAARAVVAVADPSIAQRWMRNRRDRAWESSAEEWLQPFRAADEGRGGNISRPPAAERLISDASANLPMQVSP